MGSGECLVGWAQSNVLHILRRRKSPVRVRAVPSITKTEYVCLVVLSISAGESSAIRRPTLRAVLRSMIGRASTSALLMHAKDTNKRMAARPVPPHP